MAVSRRTLGIALSALLLAGCDDPLYSNLSEREANRMIALLRAEGMSATRRLDAESGTYSITIRSSEFAEAVTLLEEHNLPNTRFSSLGEIFMADGLVTSPFEERARFVYAMNQELSRSISSIDGVIEARVHLVIPKDNPLDPGSEKARASVFLYHSPDFPYARDMPKIKMAVANSIDKLSYEDVSVMTFNRDRI